MDADRETRARAAAALAELAAAGWDGTPEDAARLAFAGEKPPKRERPCKRGGSRSPHGKRKAARRRRNRAAKRARRARR